MQELKAAGVRHDVIAVPGALEIPAAIAIALDAAEKNGKSYDAAIALGCVVRGDTIHFEIVSMKSSRGLMDLAVARKFPLGNGIITVNTEAQAWARARASELNKGGDAALVEFAGARPRPGLRLGVDGDDAVAERKFLATARSISAREDSIETISKWMVSPRITQPSAIAAS